jgi:HTH-type transcriptional regulator / antitoxin HigA
MPKTKTHKTARSGDGYMEMLRRFALKTIKNDREHEEATAMISGLMGRDLDSGAGDYLDALLVLVGKYEDEHHAIDETMTPRQALGALMESNSLSQADIGRIIGSESAVSMFLKEDRDLSNDSPPPNSP